MIYGVLDSSFKFFTENISVPAGEQYCAVEAPKGEFGIFIKSDNSSRPYRCKFKSSWFLSFAAFGRGWSRDVLLADLVAIIGTQDIVSGEIDR